ncbi:MAG: transglycosylase SLT domain-containing protein [Deltaproteobacteria bacterium]|nr:transglycosylase SLT domain-containing protein [Deltaproteobacteria bacterium]
MDSLVTAVAASILSLLPHWKSEQARERAHEYASIIVEESAIGETRDPEIDPFLVVAIIFRESSFRAEVKGKHGEVGLMQVMPLGTLTRTITKDSSTDVRANIRAGIGHLRYWQAECGSDMLTWVSAYNAGKCIKTGYGRRIISLYCNLHPGGCGGVS